MLLLLGILIINTWSCPRGERPFPSVRSTKLSELISGHGFNGRCAIPNLQYEAERHAFGDPEN